MPRVAVEADACEPEQLALFDAGVDLALLRIERAAAREAKRSDATRRAYAVDWRDFAGWCVAAGRVALPASSDTVSLYLVGQAHAGKAVATIERRAAAIAARHLTGGHPSPVTADVREVLYGLRRKLGTAPRRAKAALSIDELRAMVAALPADLFGVRDRAVLLVGFASGLRRSELAALELGDVAIEARGLVLQLRRSKTDQASAGRELGVHRGRRRSTDPVAALEAWLVERGRWAGALFCRIQARRRGEASAHVVRAALSPAGVAAIVHAAAKRAGLEPGRFGGHSLRAGLATAAAAAGAPELAIMRRTGHKSVTMVERYVRHGTLFAVDPLAGVL